MCVYDNGWKSCEYLYVYAQNQECSFRIDYKPLCADSTPCVSLKMATVYVLVLMLSNMYDATTTPSIFFYGFDNVSQIFLKRTLLADSYWIHRMFLLDTKRLIEIS